LFVGNQKIIAPVAAGPALSMLMYMNALRNGPVAHVLQ